jgi:two-component system NarL family response regulator
MSSTERIRVLLADHHQIVRVGLQEMLESAGNFEVVGHAGDGEEASRYAQELKPDVVIMDVLLPVKEGIETCREIKEALPDTQVIILTASTEEYVALEAVLAGATGYLQKDSGKERLLATVRDVAEGEFRIPGEVIRQLLSGRRLSHRGVAATEVRKLTARQQEILTLFAQGLSYAQIAEVRGKRPLTIRNSIYGIQRKLQAKSKQEMVVWAVRNGLLDGVPERSQEAS